MDRVITLYGIFSGFAGLACGLILPAIAAAQSAPRYEHAGFPADCTIILPEGATAGTFATNTWPDGIVPYVFNENVTPENQQKGIEAMAEIEAVATVDFIPRTDEVNYVMIRDDPSSNASNLGMIGGEQTIWISAWNAKFIIVHELMHTLAIWHEQQRKDRDEYVTINWDNISCCLNNYEIPANSEPHGPYDFASVMHYRRTSFSENGDTTIDVLHPYKREWQRKIGSRQELSTGDKWVLFHLYGGTPPPSSFELASPDHGAAVGADWMPTFEWTQAEQVETYRLIVDDDGAFTSPEIDVVLGEPSYVHNELLPANRLFHWTVIATNEYGDTNPFPFRSRMLYTDTTLPEILHVDASAAPGGSGSEWAGAMRSVCDAALFSEAVEGGITEVRVAQGEYRPDYGTGDRTMSFPLVNGVTLRGGFAGIGEPDPDVRDPSVYKSILTGDLAGDDEPGFVNTDENSYAVVYAPDCDETAVIDGFHITGGNANGPTVGFIFGGGINNDQGSPTVRNCVVHECSAFIAGGGVANFYHGDPVFEGCLFKGNRITLEGINGIGGAVANFLLTTARFTSCRFEGNEAGQGGGVFVFDGNMFFHNCAFTGNEAIWGGGIRSFDTIMWLSNCTLASNDATIGGAINGALTSHAIVANSIIWDNDSSVSGLSIVSYSNIQGGETGEGNIDVDPNFVDAAAGDLRLAPGSPCIDAADNAEVPEGLASDIDGAARFVDDADTVDTGKPDCVHTMVDMGAHEFQTGFAGMSVVCSSPTDGAIDARQPSEPDGTAADGWDSIELTFDADASGVAAADFELTLDPPGETPQIVDVIADGTVVTLQLAALIPLESWTTVMHLPSGMSIRFGYLPADANNDGTSNANDVLFLIDALNGAVDPPPAMHQTDTDRSGAANANDVLRVIDLLNGAGEYDVWNGAALPD